MNLKKSKKEFEKDNNNADQKPKINYNEDIETDTFDYFEHDDPFKEIIIC
jgi:hypothetical protein